MNAFGMSSSTNSPLWVNDEIKYFKIPITNELSSIQSMWLAFWCKSSVFELKHLLNFFATIKGKCQEFGEMFMFDS